VAMLRYHFIDIDVNDHPTSIQTIGCEDDSVAWRQANNLLSLNHHSIEVWRDGFLVHRVGHRRP
jgi:hypothetical protein